MSNFFHNVLVARFSALGDVCISIPVLYSVCRAYPDVRFVMLTRSFPAKAMLQRPENLVVETPDLKQYGGPMGMRRLAKELKKKYDIDAMADLHSVLRTWMLGAFLRLKGVKVARIDKGRGEKKALVKGKIHRQLTTSHDRYVKVFEALGFSFNETFDGYHGLQSSIVPQKAETHRWVAVAPFSQHEGKVYPLEKISAVVDALAQMPNVTVWLFGGGEKEKNALHPLAEKHANVHSVPEIEHQFADELALMAQCDVMLSMDSANMHLAALVGTPVVSVWGATHPYCGFMGWRQSEDNAIQLDMPCRPCSVFGNKPCRYADYRCLTGIKPEAIIEKIKKIID